MSVFDTATQLYSASHSIFAVRPVGKPHPVQFHTGNMNGFTGKTVSPDGMMLSTE
jgi:hypothetical protein